MSEFSIGIDLGGTNFRIALYQGLSKAKAGDAVAPIFIEKEEVGDDRSPDAVVALLRNAIAPMLESHGVRGAAVGIGFAGMMADNRGHVANSPHFGWLDVPFGELVREQLDCRVVVENDVNAITYGEVKIGSAVGAKNVLAVLAGTGIGGGTMAGGHLVRGSSGCATEIGHTKVVISEDARPCYCGKRGCVEAYAGGRNLRARIRSEIEAGAQTLAADLAGGPSKVEISHVDAAAAEGDDYALALYEEIAPLLGLAIANAITLLNPECLILGGGVLSRTPLLREQALAAMVVAANEPALRELRIVDAALGDQAGLIGSALLALEV